MKEAAIARFDTRMPLEQKKLLEHAAVLSGYKTLAAFILHAAKAEAEKIVEKHNTIIASERDSKVFFNAVMKPPLPNNNLKKALADYKSLTGV